MARYAGLLLAPAEGFGLWPRLFWVKKRTYYAVLAHFWRPVVTLVIFSSDLRNFESNPKKPKKKKKIIKSQTFQKDSKNPKQTKKSNESKKNPKNIPNIIFSLK